MCVICAVVLRLCSKSYTDGLYLFSFIECDVNILFKMAKFHNYYVLCPLIDQKSFLGVSQDHECDNIVVTLCRNIVNKYRLSDQKQLIGWTSKDHITTSVVYDQDQGSYIGVFNNNIIKMWKNDSDKLDKLKKIKFPNNISRILPRSEDSALIIFSNGICASLPYAIENKKDFEGKSILKDVEVIIDAQFYKANGSDHVCYIVKTSKNCYDIVFSPIRTDIGTLEKSKLHRVSVTRTEDVRAIGLHLSANLYHQIYIYVLWSDSKMTTYNILNQTWKTVGTVPWISTSFSVSMTWLGKDHLILFGSNMDQDGAVIVAYNIVLGVGTCKYPMKMYTENAKIYCLNNRIILEASNYIGVLPFVLEAKRNLSSLLGSHEIIEEEKTEIANWIHSGQTIQPACDTSNEIQELMKLGVTERTICNQLVPQLLEKHDISGLLNTLNQFTDIPESVVVSALSYAVKSIISNTSNYTTAENIAKLCTKDNDLKLQLINSLLQITFSDALLIPYLKNGIALNDTLFLLSYISYLLMHSNKPIDVVYESKLFDWFTVLIDAFYQQYIMTKDENVTTVLDNTLNVVKDLINQLMKVNDTLPLINKILCGKEIINEEEILPYNIELMNI